MMKGMIFAERYQLEDFIGQGGMSRWISAPGTAWR